MTIKKFIGLIIRSSILLWTPKLIESKLLYWGDISELAGNQMPNKVTGRTDYITVGGTVGSYTFEVPNTLEYKYADTDYLWWNRADVHNTVLEETLVSYDFDRTVVKYDNTTPFNFREILILKESATLTADEIRSMTYYMELSIWWNLLLEELGYVKGNRGPGKGVYVAQEIEFVTTWNTELAGSATKTIVLPCAGSGYDAYINWRDGSAEEHITGSPGNVSHVYSTTGIKTVSIRGVFPRIYFNNTGDKLKLLTIENWGTTQWTSMQCAFFGCANLTGNYTDSPNTSIVTDFSFMFAGCTLFNSSVNFNTSQATTMQWMFRAASNFNQPLTNWDTSKVTNMSQMFQEATLFNQPVNHLNVGNVTNMYYMFSNTRFNQSLSNWDVRKVTQFGSMFQGCWFNQPLSTWETDSMTYADYMFHTGSMGYSIATFNVSHLLSATMMYQYRGDANYDALLISWSAQSVQPGVVFDVGSTKYHSGAPANGKAILTSAPNNWTIIDGGQI